jgi:hypothetical protein
VPTNPFATVVNVLDLAAATSQVERNDLLPPRLEDKVGGEVGNRFTAWLAHEMQSGRYRPEQAAIVPVSKPGLATRPAALVNLRDRVVYEAIVGRVRESVEASMQAADVVLWPRGFASPPRWQEFNGAPAESAESTHVVLLDISTFYESIDHQILASRLLQIGVRPPVAEALEAFLGQVMGTRRGLPQGLSPSDVLATAYLAELDASVVREGYRYFRHGDDMRMSVAAYGEWVRATAFVEANLRRVGLNLNGAKARVLTIDTYRSELGHLEATKTSLRRRLEEIRVARLREGDQELLALMLERRGFASEDVEGLPHEDLVVLLAPDTGPYQSLDFDEAVELLRTELTPDDEDLARTLFTETLERGPLGDRSLKPEEAHERLRDALTTLGATGNPFAVRECAGLLMGLPAETELIVSYLTHLPDDHAADSAVQLGRVLADPGFRHASQDAWLLGPFINAPASAPPDVVEAAGRWVGREGESWIRRVTAARLLAAVGVLDQATLRHLWDIAPSAFRPDLIAAAASIALAGARWAHTFIDTVRDDRVCAVVLHHLGYHPSGSLGNEVGIGGSPSAPPS